MRLHKGILQFVVCIGVAVARPPLARAQDAAPATLRELLNRTEATPTPSTENPRSKPRSEVSATAPNEKPAPIVEQIPPPEELATPAATAERKRPRVRKRAIVRRKAPTSLSAAKAVAISAPLPDYPYLAKRAHITGSGVCVMLVDRRSGRVTRAMMEQSTGNAILDKITTDTFAEWRFKPRTVSQVQVPITYR
jgi:TonB family protein